MASLKGLEKKDPASVDAVLRSGLSSGITFQALVSDHVFNAFNLQYGESGCRSTDQDVLLQSAELIQILREVLTSLEFLRAIASTVRRAQQDTGAPMARKQAFLEFFRWFQHHGHINSQASPEVFAQAHDLIIQSLTDIWSNIRKACARALPEIFVDVVDVGPENDNHDGGQAEVLYSSLRQFLVPDKSTDNRSPDSTWQQKEGALRGIKVVIGRFEKWGSSTFDKAWHKKLPNKLQADIRQVILPMLSHVQLSVRDTASEAFGQLAQRLPPDGMKATMSVMLENLLKPPVLASGQLVEAASAEGLLKVN